MFELANVTADASIDIAAPAEVVWDAATDLTKTPERSIEARETAWVPPAEGPAVGAVFRGVNARGDWTWTVECHVTAADRPTRFEWNVLYEGEVSSTWWYRIEPTATGCTVHHGFQHGPGPSGLTQAMARHPERADALAQARTAELAAALQRTLEAIRSEAEARAAMGTEG